MTAFIELVENAALLLALGVLYDSVTVKPKINQLASRLLTGLGMGAIGLLIMSTPWVWKTGINFDTRSVLLSVGGLFFGAVPTAIAMAMTALYRIVQGGSGTLMGVAVIVTSGGLGLAWRAWRRRRTRSIHVVDLYLLGLVVHLAMLFWMIALPPGVSRQVFVQAGPPIMIVYPLCTVLLGLLLFSRDARQQAQAALEESERQLGERKAVLQAILDHSPALISIKDLDGNVTLANRNMGSLEGPSAEEYVGRNVYDLFPPDVAESLWRNDLAALEADAPIEAEEVVAHRDGTSHTYLTVKFPVYMKDDQPFGICAISTDITQRKQAEETLRKSEERFRTLAQISPVGIFLTDARGLTTYWNERLSEITNMPASEAMGLGWIEDVHPVDRERVAAKWQKCFEQRIPIRDRRRVQDRDGQPTWVIVEAVPMMGVRDELLGYVGTITDVSELVRAQEALEEYSEQLEAKVEERTRELAAAQEQLVRREKLAVLGQMAGGVAHELRNPLGVISNAVYYLHLVNSHPDPKTGEYLQMIATEVQKAERITSDLLDFARIKASDRQPVAAASLVAGTLVRCPPPATVSVSKEIPDDLPLLYVDAQQIEQVLANLFTNAYQAMPDGGTLAVRAVVDGDRVALSVADTGIGIPPENMERLFEPLFTTKTRGIGLGLAISRHLIEANGGTIAVESVAASDAEDGRSRGTTFTMALPAKETAS